MKWDDLTRLRGVADRTEVGPFQIAILVCEREEDANIKSAEDAIWWSIATMTTVGYGDRYPITTEGRVVGIVLMICGVGMFAALSGLVASMFLGKPEPKADATQEILARLERLEARLNASKSEHPLSPSRDSSG